MTQRGGERLRKALRDHKTQSGEPWEFYGSGLRAYIEKGVPANPQDSTLARIDDLLGWERGDARAVFEEELAQAPPIHFRADPEVSEIVARIHELVDQLARRLR